MFRAECKAGTKLGRMACSILTRGELVPDEIVNGIVAGRIARADCAGGFLLDGYPRTVPQAAHFAKLVAERKLPDPIVIHLDVADCALVGRLTARRQCPKCLQIYNLRSQQPRVAGVCDGDGAELITRADDREEVIRERLRAYRDLTGPILDWYGAEFVRRVDGSLAPELVSQAVERTVMEACQSYASLAR